ncbi:hypothetical protein I4U23_014457 [Adineta vaga]|nr:hypothetical protein I4U23_014457 [Adineta vaga]
MVSSRCIFIFAALFMAMVITISSAPLTNDESKFDKTEEKPLDEMEKDSFRSEQSFTTEATMTNRLLFKDVNEESKSIDIKDNTKLLFEKDSETATKPEVEDRESTLSNELKDSRLKQE